jgi:hypothetical protein
MILESLDVSPAAWEKGTGWRLKPEGACKGEVCVPLGDAAAGPSVDAAALAERLGMPLVADDEKGLWALGPATVTGRSLQSAEVPELVLPALDGRPFAVSSLRGQKVVVVAWASW